MIDKIILGDCLEVMKNIPDHSVDFICSDLPYGTTSCKWDNIIPLEPLWQEYNRIIVQRGVIALFGSEPFSSKLRLSNLKDYKYDWIWNKKIPSGMCNAKIQLMRQTENISIFIKGKSHYNPQMIKRDKPISSGGMKNSRSAGNLGCKKIYKTYDEKYPTTLLTFDKVRKGSLHPTQKPIELIEYLIKTYTNEDDVVLDNCMGSGTTCLAAKNLNRHYIGIEKEEEYFNIAKKRLNNDRDINASLNIKKE